jgi:hypothetical protein
MRDHETGIDGAHAAPPKAKTDEDRAHKRADGHAAPASPDILRDPAATHPANAEPLAELMSQLQQSHGNAYVQRFVSEAAAESPSEVRGLDGSTRGLMESAFGESFGDVRVHTGGEAERLNDELDARAVTRGRDLYFDRGEYDPATREGRELLAHELAHVVQQREDASAKSTGSVSAVGDVFEQEAERAAREVLSGGHATVVERGSAPAYQRQAREGGKEEKQAAGAINLDQHPSGPMAGGASYTYDPTTRRLTITGQQNLSVQPSRGGQVVADSARTTMAPARTRTITIGITANPLIVTVNGQTYTFVRVH